MDTDDIKDWQQLMEIIKTMVENAKSDKDWDAIFKTVIESVNQVGEKNNELASETIREANKRSNAKNFAIVALVIGMVATGIGSAFINYKNDKEWRDLISQYDFITQDGEGTNSYIGGNGDVINN